MAEDEPGGTSRRARPDSGVAFVGALAVGAAAFAVCVWRLMPGLGFWDTGEFQMVLPVMGTAHPTGYPSYVLLGWLASVVLQPLGEAALRMNVLSAILVGVGAAFTTDLGRRLSGSLVLGVVAGLGTALTPIVWAIGTHADPHALHFAFVAIILWLLVRWEEVSRATGGDANPGPLADAGPDPDARPLDEAARLERLLADSTSDAPTPRLPDTRRLADSSWDADGAPLSAPTRLADAANRRRADRWLLTAAVVVGLSVGNHSLTLLLGPPIALYVLAVEPAILRRPRLIAASIAAFAIPSVLVRFEMVLRAGWFRAPFVYADPSTWSGFWYVTLGQQFHDWFTDPLAGWPARIHALADIASSQLGPLAPIVVVAFVATIVRRPRYALLTGTAMVLTVFFNSVYPDGAIDRYYIGPALIAWTWVAILGSSIVRVVLDLVDAGWLPVRAGLEGRVRQAGLVAVGLLLLAPTLIGFVPRSRLPTVDQSRNDAAQLWTDEVLRIVQPNAVVVSWWSYSTPLWYATIVDGRRPDITIIDDRNRLDQNLGDLDQVIARYLPSHPVYLIRNGTSELPAVAERYSIVPAGQAYASNLLQVHPLATGATR